MIQTFVNGPGSPQQDGYVQKAQPGVILNGTESLGEWDEIREISGALWQVVNATYNPAYTGFQQVDSSSPSAAFVFLAGGGWVMYTAPPGAPAPISWVVGPGISATGVATNIAALPTYSVFNVVAYGADNTGTVDCTAKVQLAINAMNTAGGGILFFPQGTYLTASGWTITVNNGVKIVGAGNSTQIKISQDLPVFTIGTVSYPPGSNGVTVQDLQINSIAVSPSASAGIALYYVSDFRLENLSIFGTGIGIGLYGQNFGRSIVIENCTISATVTGIYAQNGTVVSNCQQVSGGTYGMVLDGCPGTTHIVSCSFYGALPLTTANTVGSTGSYNALWAYDLECNYEAGTVPVEGQGSAYLYHSTGDIHLTDCWMPDGVVIGSTTETPTPVMVTGCEFGTYQHGGPAITTHSLEFGHASHVSITGCTFVASLAVASTGCGLYIAAATNKVSVHGSKFYGTSLYCVNVISTDYFKIEGNTFEGWTAAYAVGFNSGNPGSVNLGINAAVRNNSGFNPVGLYQNTYPVAASPASFQNVTGLDGTYYFATSGTSGSPATITKIEIQQNVPNGGAFQEIYNVGTDTGGLGAPPAVFAIPAPPGANIRLTYTGSPANNNDLRVQFVGN